MPIESSANPTPSPHPQPFACAIGFFDGVHRGHQAVLVALKEQAQKNKLSLAVVTFSNHPRAMLTGETVPLLTTCDEKLARIRALGISDFHVLDFTRELQQRSAEDFITQVLCRELLVKHVVVGHDFHFGQNREGNAERLQVLGEELGFGVTIVPPFLAPPLPSEHPDNAGEPILVSSRSIRELLQASQLAEANHLLGYAYTLTGTVVRGEQLGRQIGFPTANIEVPAERLIPGQGVYMVSVQIAGMPLSAVCNIGTRPTVTQGKASNQSPDDSKAELPTPSPSVNLAEPATSFQTASKEQGNAPAAPNSDSDKSSSKLTVEVHLLGFEESRPDSLYGQTLTVQFQRRLRSEQHFESLNHLREQIGQDVEQAKQWLHLDAD